MFKAKIFHKSLTYYPTAHFTSTQNVCASWVGNIRSLNFDMERKWCQYD